MNHRALILSFLLPLVACRPGQPCPTCDADGVGDDDLPDDGEDIPDLPCGGADLQTDRYNCGTCGKSCLAARGESPRAASLGLFAEGVVAETCSTPGTTAFRLLALAENSGARRHEDFHHGLLVEGVGAYEAGGCVDGVCGPTWIGVQWLKPSLLTCDDVCLLSLGSCQAAACAGLTGLVCESIFFTACTVMEGGGPPLTLVEVDGSCDEPIPWPEETLEGGDRVAYCCCG